MVAIAEAVQERSPQSEIYGRSLSTIHTLGAFAIGRTHQEVIDSPEAAQARAEFYTSVEEGFATDMELGGGLEVRDFHLASVVNGKVMARDNKRPVSDMTAAGLECAEETAKTDERFGPQLTRSFWDHNNAQIVDQMAAGETDYSTRIVVSPFPEEGAAASGAAYWRGIGYVPHLRRGFVQLYHVTKDGVLTGSLSFSGSNREKLREVFGEFGVEIPEDEVTDNWLAYAITRTLSDDEAKALATKIADAANDLEFKKTLVPEGSDLNEATNTVDVTRKYGPLMERVFNESYVHVCESLARGYQTVGVRELIYQFANQAHHFNQRYSKALYRMRASEGQFTDDDSIVLHELLVYSTIEMMRALHLQETAPQYAAEEYETVRISPTDLQMIDPAAFQHMLGDFGADGARNNRVYSACGLEIGLGGEKNPDGSYSPQAAFGGLDRPELDEDGLGSRWFTCPRGHLNYRRVANVKEKNCTTCKADISCEAPKPPKPKTPVPPTWEQFLGHKPMELPGLKSRLGQGALVGAGRS